MVPLEIREDMLGQEACLKSENGLEGSAGKLHLESVVRRAAFLF
jgi:hypothetical protein